MASIIQGIAKDVKNIPKTIMDSLASNVAFANPLPSFHPKDLLVGIITGVAFRLVVYFKAKNAKKFRHGVEYGSARWGIPSMQSYSLVWVVWKLRNARMILDYLQEWI